MDFSYKLPAVKGIQANKEYYIAMVPLRMLSRLFTGDDEYVLPEYRAQRRINQARIPSIRKYILGNRDSYVFSALAASIDGEYRFIESTESPLLGTLEISMDAKFLINDGQHRKAAILEALAEDASLQNETISIVFYEDLGLARSQQMFTDLNKHAVKTSNSISELYDARDPLAVATRDLIANIPFYNKYTDKEKDNLGKYSSKLFTLNNFYNANKRLLRDRPLTDDSINFLNCYWNGLYCNIIPWKELMEQEISKVDLRENFVITQAVMIQVLGRLGASIISRDVNDIQAFLLPLQKVDWRRTSPLWINRIIRSNGRIITSEEAIMLACNVIKKLLSIPLDRNEQLKEQGIRIEE